MRETIIMGGLLTISAAMLIVFSGCGAVSAYHTNCERWATKTSYRTVCKSYSSNGHCSFWGQEAYQESYCTRWKSKSELEYEKSLSTPTLNTTTKTSDSVNKPILQPGKFILKAGESTRFSGSEELSKGEVFLQSQLEPFLCNIVKSDDIEKTLASMGRYEKISGKSHKIKYSTDIFHGTISFLGQNKNKYHLYITPQEKHFPFNGDEFGKWLSNIGLDVLLQTKAIYGLTSFRGGDLDPKDFWNYDFSIEAFIYSEPDKKLANLICIKGDIEMIWKKTLCHD